MDVLGLQIGATVQKQLHNVSVASSCSLYQRSIATQRLGLQVGATVQQQFHCVHVPMLSCKDQCRSTIDSVRLHVGTTVQQQLSCLSVASYCRPHQRREAALRGQLVASRTQKTTP
uniref:Uncharacterized protein n=1 Tax=Cafeteria roenbergensis TaxID=33653 RepID=A0A6U1LGJ6_CAFRO